MRMLKHILIFYLALNTLGCAWIYPVIYLDFSLRQDFIAETLCINRDKPITVCNGNCFLNRQLHKAQEQQQEKQSIFTGQADITFFTKSFSSFIFSSGIIYKVITFTAYTADILPSDFTKGFFHPPQV
jgi:hypothetical protein